MWCKFGHVTALEREGNNLNSFKDASMKNGKSQGHNLALTVLFAPSLLCSGCRVHPRCTSTSTCEPSHTGLYGYGGLCKIHFWNTFGKPVPFSIKKCQNRPRNVKRFRGGLVFKAHRLLYHSTLGLRVIKTKKKIQVRA